MIAWLTKLFTPRTWRVIKHEVLDARLEKTRYVIESSDGSVLDLRGGPAWWRHYPSGKYADGFHMMLQEWETQREWYKKEGKEWP